MNVKLAAFYSNAGGANPRILGHVDVSLPDFGVVLHQVVIKEVCDRVRALMPSRYVVENGQQLTDDMGRRRRTPCMTFEDHADFEKFEAEVLALARAQHPEIFNAFNSTTGAQTHA